MAELTYFPVRGRAELSRLILEQAGAKYKDTRVKPEDWPALKATLPFGQIPYYQDEEVKLPQSLAIARHLARKHHLAGKNLTEQAYVDVFLDAAVDLFTAFFRDIGEIKEGKTKSLADASDKFAADIDKLKAQTSKSAFLVGDSVSLADLMVFNLVDNYLKPILPDLLSKHAGLAAHHAAVSKLPNIAAYLASDRRPVLTLPPNFGVLCTPEVCK